MSNAAKIYARELIAALKMPVPFDVRDAARSIGLEVEFRDVTGFEGALVCSRANHVGTIIVSTATHPFERQRFTIAHEIAHYILPHHGDAGVSCASEQVESWIKSAGAEKETEANVFASEFLMPRAFVSPEAIRQPPSFESIRRISHRFLTSLTASAYRLMDLTTFPAAIVWSMNATIRWFKASDEFEGFIPVREQVAEGSYAYDCFRGVNVPDKLSPVNVESWIDTANLRLGQYIQEHSVWLPSYNSVLTLLYIDRPLEHTEEEGSLLDELRPEDFTLRRRRWPK